MTAQQKKPEYIITEDEFVELANCHSEGISPARIFDITVKVKSRPYDEQAIRQDVLDMFFLWLEDAAREGANNQYFLTWADIDCLYRELKDNLRCEQQEGGE